MLDETAQNCTRDFEMYYLCTRFQILLSSNDYFRNHAIFDVRISSNLREESISNHCSDAGQDDRR